MPELYRSRAELYDLVYAFKDYAAEAALVRDRLSALGVASGSTVLEGAMGTGGHALHLASHYRYAGFDVSPEMVALARRKLPDASLFVADLRSFAVAEPVDAFVCLFSSIGYLLDAGALARCARAIASSVRPGGALVIEPWVEPEQWEPGRPTLQVYDDEDVKIARATVAAVEDGDIAVIPMTYLVARRGGRVETFTEVHRLWLVRHEWLAAHFSAAGFDVTIEPGGPTGRSLLVGTRRGGP